MSMHGSIEQRRPIATMNTDAIRSSLFATSSGRNNASSSSSSYGRPSASQSSFGGRPSGSSDLNDRIYAEQSERMLESQNDALANRLSEKVNLLKQISIDFGVEVKEQNAMLADMDADFESTQGFMKKTLGGMTKIMNGGSSQHMCHLVGFIFFVFLLVWWLVR